MNLNREEIFIHRGARKDWAPDVTRLPKGYLTTEAFQRELARLKAADPDIYHDLIAHPERFAKKSKALPQLGPIIRESFRESQGDAEKQAHFVRSVQHLREFIYTECLESAWDLVKLLRESLSNGNKI